MIVVRLRPTTGLSYNEGRAWLEQRKFMLKTLRELGFGKGAMEDVVTCHRRSFQAHRLSQVQLRINPCILKIS